MICLLAFSFLMGCKKEGNYPGATISPFISIYDLRGIFKGNDVVLTKDNMFGSNKITGLVVSDHSEGNLPEGLLVIQERRRLSQLRGISIALGADAAAFVPGDSVIVDLEGSTLKRENGILQIKGLAKSSIVKVSSGNTVSAEFVQIDQILANPDKYESVLTVIVKAGFNPIASPGETLAGDKTINDSYGDLTLRTLPTAAFADKPAPFNSKYYGIVFNTIDADKKLVPHIRMRTGKDVVVLSSTIEVAPIVITGFMSDVVTGAGNDANYEYIQLMATEDIDFSVTPYSVVTTNNANASTPTGFPVNGWATGGVRTYKFNLTSGTAAKGTFFYVGGTAKVINGVSSTSISSANWVKAHNYSTTNGDDFGTRTTNLLANSGNASGIAVFRGTNVDVNSIPVDVIFVGTGGSLYTPGPPARGYRIANTDWYDIKHPILEEEQPFYRQGSNTRSLSYNTADAGIFNMLGGEYSPTLGRWMKVRSQKNVLLSKTSTIDMIEGEGSTKLR